MSAQLIDGKALAQKFRDEVQREVQSLTAQGKRPPHLAVLLVGDDPASHVYVKNKEKACHDVGIKSTTLRLAASTPFEEVRSHIARLNQDEEVDGILPQLPMPAHIRKEELIASVYPTKDVDGLTFYNQGRLMWNLPALQACTPRGVMELIKSAGVSLPGKRACVIGRSVLVGSPVAMMLMHAGTTVTTVHSKTVAPEKICREADIIVAAAGVKKLVNKAWVKPGAVVIDVGIHRGDDGKLCGDVDFVDIADVASAITPVPGGVGPMTIAMLLRNCLDAYLSRH